MMSSDISFKEYPLHVDHPNRWLSILVVYSPLVIMVLYSAFLVNDATTNFAREMTKENRPVELLTFAAAIIAGMTGLGLSWRCFKTKMLRMPGLFYLLFALGMLLVGMEEVAWGQQFIGFNTPESWKQINYQGETTLHNYSGLQYRLEALPLVFGLGGLVGIGFRRLGLFPTIAPPLILGAWFFVIAAHSSIDLIQDFYVINDSFDRLINTLDEVSEMCVAISATLYISFNARMIRVCVARQTAQN